ncbi:calpain-14 [Sminthopsis crassicaudata]|uniref:calpain-14 n=1 Tax=Sminthopsis crassicaudata TaxID=9301 RepID=UPI003D685D50
MSLCVFLKGKSPKHHNSSFRRESFARSFHKPQQDYETLLETCLRNNRLFEDPSFPADMNSIGRGSLLQKLPPTLHWKRPIELHDNPVFYSTKAGRLGLCQGVVGNCWFLAALEALTFHGDILNQVVPLNQSFTKKYAGIFLFQFWHFGEWIPVVIDDRLPVNEAGHLVFVSSTYKNLFWAALLEKAYAKLSGSYEDLQTGHVSEAFVDFTGGVTATIQLAKAPSDLWDILTRVAAKRALIGCQTHSGKERILNNGLVDSHAYTVTGIRKVTCHNRPEYLVRLRNPWGKVEWKGDWSDRSNKWDLLNPKEKILLLRKDEDGEFWMSFNDFKFHFGSLVFCQLTPDLMSQEVGKKWMYSLSTGRWVKGSTAGGQLRHHTETFWMNPQFQLTVLSADEVKKSSTPCSVLVLLMQKSKSLHRNQMKHLPIGIFLFRVNEFWKGNERLPQEFFQRTTPLFIPRDFQTEREVSYEFYLEPDTYLIVPCTSEPWLESEFILRVFSRKHALYEMGSNCSFILPKEIVDKYEGEEEFFIKLFEKYPEINAIQLQKILNNMTWTYLSNPKPTFSMDACLGILALFDFNATGTVGIQEFRCLWKRLLIYQEVFHKQDKHKSGFLESGQLRAAAQEAGILLSDEVCNLMAIRYGSSNRKIGFENFVYFMLRAENVEGAFQNMTQDNKGIYLLKSELLCRNVPLHLRTGRGNGGVSKNRSQEEARVSLQGRLRSWPLSSGILARAGSASGHHQGSFSGKPKPPPRTSLPSDPSVGF